MSRVLGAIDRPVSKTLAASVVNLLTYKHRNVIIPLPEWVVH